MKKVPYRLVALITLILLLVTFSLGAGCQHQKSIVQRVDFTATTTSGNVPLTVQFTDQSIGDISSWLWFFGDGQTSTEQNPSHTYTGDGVYNVSLVVIEPDNSHETETREDYISVGNPAPPWALTIHEALYWDYDIPPQSEFVTLDLVGEGVLYWTSFNVKDRSEADWGATYEYKHSIYVDGKEVYDELNSVVEIWTFQQNAVRTPDSFYPAIYSTGQNFLHQAFGRLDIPFNETLSVTSANTHPEGIITVNMVHAAYGLAGSGVPSSKGGRRGEEWGIKQTSEELEFPVAPKLKAALEKEFGKKVFSVGIIRRSSTDDPEVNQLLWVDAPEIDRDEIRNFLVWEELIELAYELTAIDFTANPVSGSAPLTVQFTNRSSLYKAGISGWLWSFGDGQTSTEQHPSHTYTAEGVYTVSLEAQSTKYGAKTESRVYIRVGR